MAPRKTSQVIQPESDPQVVEDAINTLDEKLKEVEAIDLDPPDYFEILGLPKPESLAPIEGNWCPNCQEKLRTDLVGRPMCPADLPNCPRNSN